MPYTDKLAAVTSGTKRSSGMGCALKLGKFAVLATTVSTSACIFNGNEVAEPCCWIGCIVSLN